MVVVLLAGVYREVDGIGKEACECLGSYRLVDSAYCDCEG